MKRKDRLDILPFPLFWCDSGSSIFDRARDQMVDNTVSFRLSQILAAVVLFRLSRSNTMQPVVESAIERYQIMRQSGLEHAI